MKKNGQLWISDKSNQLRYQSNNEERYLQPLSIYTIGGANVIRGEWLSIDTNSANDNTVVKTDSLIHTKTIGVAAHDALIGQTVRIIPIGNFEYNIAKFPGMYIPSVTDSDKGKPFYIGTTPGQVTFSRENAILGNRNLIEIGIVSNVQSPVFNIEILIEGDGRGPIGFNQFEYTVGEDILVKNTENPKVVALGDSAVAKYFRYNLKIKDPLQYDSSFANKWLVISSANKALVLQFGNGALAHTNGADLLKYNDIISKSLSVQIVNIYSPTPGSYSFYTNQVSNNTDFVNRIIKGIVTNTNFLSAANSYLTIANNGTTYSGVTDGPNNPTQEKILDIIANVQGGPLFIDWDSSLNIVFKDSNLISSVVDEGNYVNAGKAILADSSLQFSRINTIGFITKESIGSAEIIPKDSKILVTRQGRLSGFNLLSPGSKLFLGKRGGIVSNPASIIDSRDYFSELGSVVDANTVDIDIKQSTIYRERDIPIGGIDILPAGVTQANYGYLLTEGQTLDATVDIQYQLLFDVIGTLFGGSNNTNFQLPNLNSGSNKYQMKYASYGALPITPPVWRKTFTGTFPVSGNIAIELADDILTPSYLSVPIELSEFIVKVHAVVGSETIEIPQGIFQDTGSNYGYTFKKTSFKSFDLVPGSNGFAFRKADGTIQALDTQAYVITVFRPEQFLYYRNVNGGEGTGSGGASSVVKKTAGENITKNQLVYINSAQLAFVATKTDVTKSEVVGIALATVTTGQALNIQVLGEVINAGSGLTSGQRVYLGNNGAFTQDKSSILSGNNEASVSVGIATSPTNVFITVDEPKKEYLPDFNLTPIAGEDIGAFKAVAIDSSGNAIIADRSFGTKIPVMGFTTKAFTSGQTTTLAVNGQELGGFSGLSAGKYLYLNNNGDLTHTTSGFIQGDYRQAVAIALSPTSIVINIEEPTEVGISGTIYKEGIGLETSWPALGPVPNGWLECDGSLISRTVYADLFAVLGTLYGAGDGSSTFALPDRRGIFFKGAGFSNSAREMFDALRMLAVNIDIASTATDTITTSTAHGLSVGDMIFIYGGTSNATSDRLGIGYVTAVPLATTLKVSATFGGTAYATYTNTGKLKIAKIAKSNTPAITVLSGNNITVPSHGLNSGDIVIFGNGTIPTGLTALEQYRVTKIDANIFTLTSTKSGALATVSGTIGGIFYKLLQDVGTIQLDSLQGHNHDVPSAWTNSAGGVSGGTGTGAIGTLTASTIKTDGLDGTPRISPETRPLNVTTRWVIRYLPLNSSSSGSNSSSVQSNSNLFKDETFSGTVASQLFTTSGSLFTYNTTGLLIGDTIEGKLTGVGNGKTIIDIPKALRNEVIELGFDGVLNGPSQTLDVVLTDGNNKPVPHNGSQVTINGKFRYFVKFFAPSTTTMNVQFTLGGTTPDFRIQNLIIRKEQTIYGSAKGPKTVFPIVAGTNFKGTTGPTFGTVVENLAYWQQDGEEIFLAWRFKQSSVGTNGTGTYALTLPNGFTIDLTKKPVGSDLGSGIISNASDEISADSRAVIVVVKSATEIEFATHRGVTDTLAHWSATNYGVNNTSTTLSISCSIPVQQLIGSGVVQLASSGGPMYLSNQLFTTNANETTGVAYTGADGAPFNTAVASNAKYCDIIIPRALLANEKPVFEVRSKVDGEWYAGSDVGIPSLSIAVLGARLSEDAVGNTSVLRGVALAKVTAGKLRVFFPVYYNGGISANFVSSSIAQHSTIALTSAVDGFDRWRVRIGPQNAVELPPLRTAELSESVVNGGYVSSACAFTRNTLNVSINASNEYIIPFDGQYTFNLIDSPHGTNANSGCILYINGAIYSRQDIGPVAGWDVTTSLHTQVYLTAGTLVKFQFRGTTVLRRVNIKYDGK